jgi:ABC-2 type transport system permease protein
MREFMLLGKRAMREIWRIPEATFINLFIPLFFLVVNIGQVSKTFDPAKPPGSLFLFGQKYVAFQLPVSMLFAVSTSSSGLALVTDIDLGYFDKLRAAPIMRTALVFSRLGADFVRASLQATLVLLTGLAFGAKIKTGVLGAITLVLLCALWGVAYAGISQTIALRTKNVQTVNASFVVFFPLLFLTPNFVPRFLLNGALQAIVRYNPVTYVLEGLRSLVLRPWGAASGKVGIALITIVITGLVLTFASLRAIRKFAD